MKMKRTRTFAALLLIVTMLTSVIFTGNSVLAAEPAGVKLEFVEVTASNTFKFTGTLADASSLPKGYYKVPATIVNDTGNVTKEITLDVGNNGAISIWSNFFHFGPGNHATLPTKALTIAKNAVFTEVQHVSGTGWSVKDSGKTYKLIEEMKIEKSQDGTWSQIVAPKSDYNEMEIGFNKVDGTSQEGIYYTTSYIKTGPDYGSGSTKPSDIYGSWKTTLTGQVLFRMRDGSQKEVNVEGFNIVGSGLYVNLTLQNPKNQVTQIKQNVASVTIQAGTILTDVKGEKTPIKITNTLTLLNLGNDCDYVAISEPNEEILATKSGKAKVILLAGQSNATGTSQVLKLKGNADVEDFARYQAGYNNVLIRYEVDSDNDTNNQNIRLNASSAFVPVGLGQGGYPRYFGPEIGIADYLSQAYPDETFYIIKSSWSGTYLGTDWQEDADVYKAFVERTDKSFKMLEDSGLEPELFAFCWMQGEADAMQQSLADDYYNKLSDLVSRVSTKYNKYIPAAGMAFIDAGISDMSDWTYHATVNNAKKAYANEKSNRYYLDTQAEGLTYNLDNTDYAHYDAMAMIRLGKMFGEAVKKVYESEQATPAEPTGVKLEFVGVTASNTFKFTGTLADASSLPKGYYKVPATIVNDSGSVTKDITLEVGNNGAISIWSNFFHFGPGNHATLPTKALTIAKDAIFTEVQCVSNVWSVVENGKTYKLTEEMSIFKGQDGTWSVGTLPMEPASVTLTFVEVTSSNTFKFTGKFADASSLPKGYYKVPATIVNDAGSVTKDITLEVGNNGAISIWSNFFHFGPGNHATLPTKALTIAKDAIFTEVQCVSNVWSVVENGKTYKLSEEMSIEKGQDGTWGKKTAGQEPGPGTNPDPIPTPDAINLTLEFVDVTGSNTFKFIGKLGDNGYLPNGFYKVAATIVYDNGTVTKDIVIEVGNNGAISIWSSFFQWNDAVNSTVPTKSLTFAKDAIFTQAEHKGGKFQVVENGKTYKLTDKMCIVNEEGWLLEGTKPVIPEIPDNIDSVNVTFNRADAKNNFNFSWKLTDGTEVGKGFYSATIKVDGTDRKVLLEGTGKGFWIYFHCFTVPPNSANPKFPTETLEIPAGTVLTPVVQNKWTTVRTDGSYYKVNNDVSIKNQDGIWILANQNIGEPLEVKISFKEVKRGALYLNVETADGKNITEIYGKNWPSASGMVIRGIADENNQFTYTKVSTQYNVVSKALYLGALSLNQLDEVKIEAGTILYMGPDAESQRPIKILNSFRMTRDASDKWVADGTVTGQGGNFTQGGSSAQAGSGSPKTGDVYTTVTWVVLMSCAGLSMILLNKKRYE